MAKMAFEDKNEEKNVDELSPEELATALKGREEDANLKKIKKLLILILNRI